MLYSCVSNSEKGTGISSTERDSDFRIINIDNAEEQEKILFSSFFTSPKTIILEFKEDCIISEISSLEMYKNKLYVLDNRLDEMFVFDKDGSFLCKIGSVGEGPGEYLEITDFTINKEDDIICLLDSYSGRIYKYDIKTLDFLGYLDVDNGISYNGIQYVSNYIYLDGDNFSENLEKYLLTKVCAETGLVKSVYLDAEIYNCNADGLRNVNSCFFPGDGVTPTYINLFMDTVIAIGEDVKSVFAIESKEFVNKTELEEIKATTSRGYDNLFELEKYYNVNNYFEAPDFVYFQLWCGRKGISNVVYNKVAQTTTKSYDFVNDYIHPENYIPARFGFNDTKGVYNVIIPDFIPHFVEMIALGRLNPSIDKYDELKNLTEESNPVIFYHEYK